VLKSQTTALQSTQDKILHISGTGTRVARWLVFNPKIPIVDVVTFYGHLEYFTAIWYNLQPLGKVYGHLVHFFPFWYVWTKKNLAILTGTHEFQIPWQSRCRQNKT
jgi:hypothetical protein